MSESLRDLRKASEKTLAEVANVLNVSEAAVCQYEKGTRQISIQQVVPLARFYGVSAEDIVTAQLISIAVRKSK